jgi:hypothetical protein
LSVGGKGESEKQDCVSHSYLLDACRETGVTGAWAG